MLGIGLAFGFLVVFFVINRFGVKAISSANSYIALAKIFIPAMTAIVLALTFFSIKNFTAGDSSPKALNQYLWPYQMLA
jgi:amino acid transporter